MIMSVYNTETHSQVDFRACRAWYFAILALPPPERISPLHGSRMQCSALSPRHSPGAAQGQPRGSGYGNKNQVASGSHCSIQWQNPISWRFCAFLSGLVGSSMVKHGPRRVQAVSAGFGCPQMVSHWPSCPAHRARHPFEPGHKSTHGSTLKRMCCGKWSPHVTAKTKRSAICWEDLMFRCVF